jgi:hypothetical protein
MPFVQIAHRWHQADGRASALPFFGEALHGGDGRNRFHSDRLIGFKETNKPSGSDASSNALTNGQMMSSAYSSF